MATIVAVHGTFATGPAEGEDWWQRGGALDRDIRELVETDDSRLDFLPHVWDGQNSEISRRAAGQALLERLAGLEQRGEKYCLIGHSHGGSVIATTLFAAGSRKSALPGLSRWLTVGTPFIMGKKRGFLYSRLGLWGKSAYVSFLALPTYLAFFALNVDSERLIKSGDEIEGAIRILVLIVALLAFVPFFLLHALLWWRDRRRSRMFSARHRARAWETFHRRWLSLRHRGDEAVEGLRAVNTIALPIFGRRFLVAPLSAIALLLAPILALLALELIPWSSLPDQAAIQAAGAKLREAGILVLLAAFLLAPALAAILAILLFVTVLVLAIQALSAALSAVLSRRFDRMTWHQIRQSAYGNDTIGEVAVEAADRPAWAGSSQAPLPDELGDEVGAFADTAAARSVSKLRRAVQLLAFSGGEQQKSDLLAQYLTWDELIHTAYFRVARFRKLVAFAIAHSPGFRPSERFKSDPDYATLARWYAELSQAGPSAV